MGSRNEKLNTNIKKFLIISFFLIISVTVFLAENSILWNFLETFLTKVFWIYYRFIFSPVLFLLAIFILKEKWKYFDLTRGIWLFIFYVSITTLIGSFYANYYAYLNLYSYFKDLIWPITSILLFLIFFIISLVILFRFSPVNFTRKMFKVPEKIVEIKDTFVWDGFKVEKETKSKSRNEKKLEKEKQKLEETMRKLREEKEILVKNKKEKAQLNLWNIKENPKKILVEKKENNGWFKSLFWKKTEIKEVEKSTIETIKKDFKNWQSPSIDLLNQKEKIEVVDQNEIRKKEIEIEEKLLQFKIEVDMQDYKVWPTVIQYRLKPKDWVKLQKIENLKKDLALALQAKSIRIQAPIPGLWVVWVEVPNPKREIVYIKEIISATTFNASKMEIPIAIWKDVSWNMVIWDLAKMPHLLVAGQTGSGKSVWMNWFLVSMLYKFSPSELKMIMVDPKRVELSVYNGIPHLLTPVITNPDKALNALKWCVAEMLRRYDLATKVKARNLKEYNKKVEKKDKLPYIVMVVDELADLMMSWNKKEVEQAIARIAQMARAVWIHLIIATQRPSVDVITWLIKANIPSRIAFTVSSQIDSRTILDKSWAEDLLGRWDMLYYPTGNLEPERVQWVLVETEEIESVVNQIKLTIDPDMLKNLQIPEIADWKSKFEGSIMEKYDWDQEEDPEIIEKAIKVVKESKKGSTSLIQRKLWLGYARAAKVLDILEELWVVWPSNGSKPREVYVD